MAYTRKDKLKIVRDMKRAIEHNRLKFFYQLFAFVPCCKQTGLDILKELGELDAVRGLISNQRTLAKVHALNRWEEADSSVLQLAFYKLIANSEELNVLSNTKHTIEAKVQDPRTDAEILEDIQRLSSFLEEGQYDISKD